MARLLSLPDELLLMICANVARQETQKPDLDSVPTLNALARTNRRFQNIAEPLLYEIGHGYLEGLPILWAAHYGIVGTLKKSIAFGGEYLLDSSIGTTFTRRERQLTQDFIKASAAWRTQDPEYWPPKTRGRLIPTTLQLDVLGPTVAPVVLDRVVKRPDHGTPDNSNPDLDQTQDLIYSFTEPSSSYSDDDGDDDDQKQFSRYASPLHVAVKEGHLEIVKILLEHDVDINAHASDFCSCVPPAGLLQGLYGASRFPEYDQENFWNPLHLAICSSRHDIAKTLIDRGAPIMGSLFITWGFQPIHQAAAQGHVDLLNYMLEKNPPGNVDVKDDFGYTPLYYAIANRHWESTVPCLLNHGADIDFTVEMDAGSYRVCLTALGATCRVGRFEDALKLIELGADAELGMKCLPSSGYGASLFPEVASLLSLCCMRPRLPESPVCSQNSTALSAQQSSFLPQLVSKLLSLDAPQHWLLVDNLAMVHEEPARNMALWHRNVEALKALRDAGVDLLVPDSQGRNGLMIALSSPPHLFYYGAEELAPREPRREEKNLVRVLNFLLDCGVGIHDKDLDGNTVLHYFFSCYVRECGDVSRGQDRTDVTESIFRFLMAQGADPLARNHAGHCAIHLIIKCRCSFAMGILSKQLRANICSELPLADLLLMSYNKCPRTNIKDVAFAPCPHYHPEIGFSSTDRIADLILDMDVQDTLARDPTLLGLCVKSRNHQGDMDLWLLADKLWQRGIHTMEMGTVERLEMLNRIITAGNGCWKMARQMLDALPDHEIDTPCSHTKVSILYAAVGRLWDILGRDMAAARNQFIHHLIEFRGAGIHTALTTLPLNTYKALAWESRAWYLSDCCRFRKQGLTMTPLLLAIYLSANDAKLQTWVERMLLLQPIRGNAQANEMLYLHKAVSMHTVLDDPYQKPLRFNCKQAQKRTGVLDTSPKCLPQQRVIRALLAAGADRTQLDEDGNTPLSLMLSWLAKRKEVVQHCCELIRPLSMGVDVNHQNSAKRSIVSYLEELIQCGEEVDGSNNAAGCVMDHLELVKLENGDREIKWLRG